MESDKQVPSESDLRRTGSANGNWPIYNIAGGNSSTYNTAIYSPAYVINSYSETKDGKCALVIEVAGKGISDSFRVSKTVNTNVLMTNTTMLLGDPRSFCLFSDAPSTLVVIEDGKCTRKTYTTADGQITSSAAPLTDEECSALLQKLADAEEKNTKHWQEWSKNFASKMNAMFPPGFPFSNTRRN